MYILICTFLNNFFLGSDKYAIRGHRRKDTEWLPSGELKASGIYASHLYHDATNFTVRTESNELETLIDKQISFSTRKNDHHWLQIY